MTTTTYIATLQSLTTFKTEDVRVDVHSGQEPDVAANRVATGYGARVVSIKPENPIELLRNTVRECLGFLEAWQAHLNDTKASKAAETVQDVLDRARAAHRFTKDLIAS